MDDGNRLSLTFFDGSFTITEVLSGKSVIYRNNGQCMASDLDKSIVIPKIQTLNEALNTYERKTSIFGSNLPKVSYSESTVIQENKHFDWTISSHGKSATLRNNTLHMPIGFDVDSVLRQLNSAYSILLTMGALRTPRFDIVRRISEVGLLVWVYDGHSVVVFEKNVDGCCMANCLVDGEYYEALLVGTSKSQGTATLFTPNLDEVLSFPLDESILTYYPDGDKICD